MSTAHRLHQLLEIRESLVDILVQEEEQRNAIVTRAEAARQEVLTEQETADFRAMSATIASLQHTVIAADSAIKNLTGELEAELDAKSLADAEVPP
ncbi:MAG: hypothetical protein K2X56_12845 [Mycobacterium pseudokansasii]|nr:hypothetical protein [Mycobacterium pseudokansasii]